jgi:hypothetical protein
MIHKFNYQTKEEKYRYLNQVAYALYGVCYNSLTFLNGNKLDFKPNNILVSVK